MTLAIILTVLCRQLFMPYYLRFKRLLVPSPLFWQLPRNEWSSRAGSQWLVQACLAGQGKTSTVQLLSSPKMWSTRPGQRILGPTECPCNFFKKTKWICKKVKSVWAREVNQESVWCCQRTWSCLTNEGQPHPDVWGPSNRGFQRSFTCQANEGQTINYQWTHNTWVPVGHIRFSPMLNKWVCSDSFTKIPTSVSLRCRHLTLSHKEDVRLQLHICMYRCIDDIDIDFRWVSYQHFFSFLPKSLYQQQNSIHQVFIYCF